MADEDDELEGDELDEYEEDGGATTVTIEVSGLSIYTHHGVTAAEREIGQRLLLDIRMEIGDTDATVTDRVEDTVDYGAICEFAALVAQQRSYKTLERLASEIADRILIRFPVEAISIKAAKPEPPIALTVEEVSVEVWRERTSRHDDPDED
ncbi:MAG: dihydroneopterin aldolase [Solirubrobacteraceae bacterium]|nr:dihydroneopterin aldolase [Solirubrobacteraceae bacterium]